MKSFLSFLAMLWALSGLHAQSSDPVAKQILDKASAKIKSYKSVKAAFTLQVQDAQGVSQGTKKGTVYLKGSKYVVLLTGQEIYSDGKNTWTYDKSANEVTVTKVESGTGAMSVQRFFSNFYDKDFLYKVNGEQKSGTQTVTEIEMTPNDKTQNFHKVYLYVDKKTYLVSPVKVLDKSGNRYTYMISNLNGNANLPDAAFMFDKAKHPGVEEVNLTQ